MTLGARKKERTYQAHLGEQLRSQRELSALNNFPSSISSTNLLMGTIMIVYTNGDTPVLSVYKSAYPHFGFSWAMVEILWIVLTSDMCWVLRSIRCLPHVHASTYVLMTMRILTAYECDTMVFEFSLNISFDHKYLLEISTCYIEQPQRSLLQRARVVLIWKLKGFFVAKEARDGEYTTDGCSWFDGNNWAKQPIWVELSQNVVGRWWYLQ